MSPRRQRLASGVLWIVFSPVALLMALIAKGGSETDYHAGVAVCGTWSVCGVISGVGTLVGMHWAVRLQMLLCWVAFAIFSASGIFIMFVGLRTSAAFIPVGVGTLLTGTPFLFWARRRQRELQPATMKR